MPGSLDQRTECSHVGPKKNQMFQNIFSDARTWVSWEAGSVCSDRRAAGWEFPAQSSYIGPEGELMPWLYFPGSWPTARVGSSPSDLVLMQLFKEPGVVIGTDNYQTQLRISRKFTCKSRLNWLKSDRDQTRMVRVMSSWLLLYYLGHLQLLDTNVSLVKYLHVHARGGRRFGSFWGKFNFPIR